MDLSSLRSYGRSPTSTAWVTNPMRALSWWLIKPFFRGANAEIERRIADIATLMDGRIAGQFDRLAEQVDARVGSAVTSSAVELEEQFKAAVVATEASLRAMILSSVNGIRKDVAAIAHRLGGLEDGGDRSDRLVAELRDRANDLAQRLEQAEIRLTGLSQQAGELSDYLGGVQGEARSAVRSLGERLEILAHLPSGAARTDFALSESGLVMASLQRERLLVLPHDHISRQLLEGREWEPHIRRAIERVADPAALAIDVGAFIGIHTLTMSRHFKTVYAFEPQRAVFQILCGNLALNRIDNVFAKNVAIYDRSGGVTLSSEEYQDVKIPLVGGKVDYDHIQNAAALSFDYVSGDDTETKAITIDSLALENVRLMKVDAQGADLRVLQGAVETIRRCRPTILFEYERDLDRHHGAELDDFHQFLSQLNYEVELLQQISPERQADYIAFPK